MENGSVTAYEEAVEYILGIPRFSKKNTPEDTRAFLRKLGDPDRQLKIIHVAGTNGKGSVCAYLASVLRAAGHRVCLFTSPHLTDIRQRFVIDGQMIGKEDFLRAFTAVKEKLSGEGDGEGWSYHPSFFEYLFFMAMLLFAESGAEYCILETGLGGRLDATNAVSKKELAVITHMGMDHTEYLGDTPEAVAGEKAGIMQAGAPAVYFETDERVCRVFTECAEKLQIPAYGVSKNDYTFLKIKNKGIDFSYRSLYYDCIRLNVDTQALYQMENASLALRALEVLFGRAIKPEVMAAGIRAAFWPGRMEEILPGICVDGAHNSDGIRAFLETVAADGCDGRRVLFFGVSSDKDYGAMADAIVESGLFDGIGVTAFHSARALDALSLRECFIQKNAGIDIPVFASPAEAFAAAKDCAGEGKRVYIAGSLYLVGEIKELL